MKLKEELVFDDALIDISEKLKDKFYDAAHEQQKTLTYDNYYRWLHKTRDEVYAEIALQRKLTHQMIKRKRKSDAMMKRLSKF